MFPVTHYVSHFAPLGGVQTLLRRHLESDAKSGLETDVVAFFDPPHAAPPGVTGLGLDWKSTVSSARKRFAALLGSRGKPTAVYHNLWGVPFLADLDGADRRIGVMHVYPSILRDCLSGNAGLLDGILCVSQPLKELVHRHLPDLESSRVAILPLPISRCPIQVQRPPLAGRLLVIGVSGRLVKEQKRIDRLPKLVSVLDQVRMNYRLELLGDGPDQTWLERQLAGHPKVFFHGRQSGEAYWRIVAEWDVILFTSDFEGLPLALLEAMSAGVLPVYPRIHSGGDSYVRGVNPEFLYDPDDFHRVAAILSEIQSLVEPRLESWREASRAAAEPHTGDAYDRVYANFVRQIREAPKIPAARLPSRRFYCSDFLPFVVLSRFY
ncbi:MAG: glycosyltransferase, partial [Verrucomicrobia bacterium]|nr:glycosyltransferase [Verrucomicrobiota bacterium]